MEIFSSHSLHRLHPHLRKLIDIIWDPDIYYIVTALRGPDSGDTVFERIFSARIRAFLDLKPSIDLSIEVREDNKIDLGDIVYAILNVSDKEYYYLEYVEVALGSLIDLLIQSRIDEEILEKYKRELRFLQALAYLLRLLLRDENELLQIKVMDKIAELIKCNSDYIR